MKPARLHHLRPLFNGGLQIPSTSVYRTIEFSEHVFRATVTGDDGQHKIINVSHHFTLDSTVALFTDHEDGDNEPVVEDDHRTQLTKFVADKYFTLRTQNKENGSNVPASKQRVILHCGLHSFKAN